LKPRARGSFGVMTRTGIVGAAVAFVTYWVGALWAGLADLMHQSPEHVAGELQRPFLTITAWEVVFVLCGFVAGAVVGRYRWRLTGLLGLIGMMGLAVGYLGYAWWVTIPAVPADLRWLSFILFGAEAGLIGLVFLASFYAFDVSARRTWERLPDRHAFDAQLQPHVCLQIPVYNEPAEMVQRTIWCAVNQDYPRDRLLVMVLDDSTDNGVRTSLEAYSKEVGALYVRRPTRGGFKAGALNYANSLLPPETEIVGIIDADYWVKPEWLRSLVGHFIDPDLGFVQSPQDYRNREQSFLTRNYHRAESYFYHAMMPSRNEENAIIFCGTMGLLRRKTLNDVGGFAEDQICEDAELSVRVVTRGWSSLYVDQSYGVGLMPATFEAYKKQFHRWALGNVRMLRRHWWRILTARMTKRQKFDYIITNLHWFDGILIMIVAMSLLYLGLGPPLGYEAMTYHQNEITLIALVPALLLIDSLVRLKAVLFLSGHGRLRDAILVQGLWFAIKFTNMRAVLRAIFGWGATFVRTPKEPEHRLGRFRALGRTLRITKMETLLALALFGVAAWDAVLLHDAPPGEAVLPVWLGMYGLFFACAPIYAYLSYRTLPMPERVSGVVARGAPARLSGR
jgi:cellulose synthase/poly-beta-1,6-N-acetylglucosamine synthase-like glycosyltransferase